jgi:hypothetical protein
LSPPVKASWNWRKSAKSTSATLWLLIQWLTTLPVEGPVKPGRLGGRGNLDRWSVEPFHGDDSIAQSEGDFHNCTNLDVFDLQAGVDLW